MDRLARALGLISLIVFTAHGSSARADEIPDHQDPDCEVAKVQKAGETCRECRTYPRSRADCAPLSAAGFAPRCERGDGREVWCKADAGAATGAAHVAAENPGFEPSAATAPAHPTPAGRPDDAVAKPGCNAIPFVLPLIGVLGLVWLRMKKTMT